MSRAEDGAPVARQNVTAGPESVTAGSESVTAQPECVTASPESVIAQPESVTAQPESVTADFESVTADLESLTAKPPRRGRGRPPGRTPQADATRDLLYQTAIRLIATRGWQAATLRDVADEAGVSVGLLYRYFPSKRAVVLALYDQLSQDFAGRAAALTPIAPWRDRFIHTLRLSLEVLGPHRATLAALLPVLVGDAEEGLFAPSTAFSRLRVQATFVEAVVAARDAPRGELGPALGRLLYVLHLAVLLWWLLDKSPSQRATTALVALLARVLRLASPVLRLPGVSSLLVHADALVREALFADAPEA
jgi:AcrR family transcriptional regulator